MMYIGPTEKEYVTPEGQIPEKFKSIIANNALCSIFLSGAYYFVCNEDGAAFTIEKYNFNFEKLLSYSFSPEEKDARYLVRQILATSDGGFLLALESNADVKNDGNWIGMLAELIKCSADGKTEWIYEFKGKSAESPKYLFEDDHFYYVIGDKELEETKTVGVYSPDDICALKFEKNGALRSEKFYGGRDYDYLVYCEQIGTQLMLLVNTQSGDGDFHASKDGYGVALNVVLDKELNIVSFEKTDWRLPKQIGILDGKNICDDAAMFLDFKDGIPTALIDYGDFYLLVSEHTIGKLEYQNRYASSVLYYTETVYGAYKKDGTLLWKATVDSTPPSDLKYAPNNVGAATE
jgi:hypothetical protein